MAAAGRWPPKVHLAGEGLHLAIRRPHPVQEHGQRVAAERTAIQHLTAEVEIDLAAARAMLGRSGPTADAFHAVQPPGTALLAAAHAFHKDVQCTKWFVLQKAIKIVDRALTASGGAGYLSKSPLSRLYHSGAMQVTGAGLRRSLCTQQGKGGAPCERCKRQVRPLAGVPASGSGPDGCSLASCSP
jgi:alkylation response protein AidB-like acyl-CoA dehydrogenase